MLSTAEGFLLSIATSEVMLGVIGNGFIAVVNCTNCARNKMISKISFILTGLAISRIFLVWLLISEAFIKIFSPNLLSSINIIELISYLWIIISQLSFWFVTTLSIFYFVKIVNFSHYIFLWLKRRINTVFFLLIGCLFVSWLFTFQVAVKIIRDGKMQYINTSWRIRVKKSELIFHYAFTNNMLSHIIFMIMSIVCFLLIISPWRHNKRMQLSESGFRDLNTEVHVKAIKVLMSFIIIFALHFMGVTINVICLFIPESNLLFMFGLTTAFIYPCCHSLILILANSQLKQDSVRILQQVKCSEKGKPHDSLEEK